MKKLHEQLLELENQIPRQEFINQAISKSPVGWHIEHSLLTINLIIQALQNSNPGHYKRRISFSKIVVFAVKKIPRGRAKAPRVVEPKIYNSETLRAHIEKAKEKIKLLEQINPGQYFDHPYFGNLKLKDTIKFLKIHTKHHMDIIDDIIKHR